MSFNLCGFRCILKKFIRLLFCQVMSFVMFVGILQPGMLHIGAESYDMDLAVFISGAAVPDGVDTSVGTKDYIFNDQQVPQFNVQAKLNAQTGVAKDSFIQIQVPYVVVGEDGTIEYRYDSSVENSGLTYFKLKVKVVSPSSSLRVKDGMSGEYQYVGENTYYSGNLFFNVGATSSSSPAALTFQFAVDPGNYGSVKEKTLFPVNVGCGFESYFDENYGTESEGYYKPAENTSEYNFSLTYTNLLWNSTYRRMTQNADNSQYRDYPGKEVMWQEYNYVGFELGIDNTSEKEEAVVDRYEFSLRVDSTENKVGKNGVLKQDIIKWLYIPDGEPQEIDAKSTQIGVEDLLVGKINRGGYSSMILLTFHKRQLIHGI